MGKTDDVSKVRAEIPYPVTNPERIPVRRYYDEEFYKLECERLWPRVWQMACRLEEIPEVGDFVEYNILDKSVLIVRTKTGIKAYHNACRHRGVRLASGRGNCEVTGFQCPFHGWRWNMDGQNTFVFQPQLFSEENMDKADLALPTCRVETAGGCAFINFDDDAPPLRDSIEPFATMQDIRHIDKMKSEWWLSTILPVNWKTAMEAFHEGYHVMRTHPQLLPPAVSGERATYGGKAGSGSRTNETRMAAYKTTKDFVDGSIKFMQTMSVGMAGMVHANDVKIAEELRDIELPEDVNAASMEWGRRLNAEIVRQGLARGLAMPDLNAVDTPKVTTGVQFCFPNYFLLPAYGNAASYRIRPLGPESCLFELWSLTLFPEDEKREPPVPPVPKAHDDPSWPPIPKQDYSNLPRQQLGLHAEGFEYMRLSREVEGLISNYQRLIDGFLTGVDDRKLLEAMPKVSGGIDVPIVDLGF